MAFVAKSVRLTNSGKVPEIFLTSKVQSPTELADAKLGKLFFVLQINAPWSSVATVGSSIVNVISREYYRQEGHVPLENFERSIAKANRLIEQLGRDGDPNLREKIHALVALVVGDEIHVAYAGGAEAYFLRGDTLDIITEPGVQTGIEGQTFVNLISGELSRGDIIILSSPGLYSGVTNDQLELFLKQPLVDAAYLIARQLKTLKIRQANAILVGITTMEEAENSILKKDEETIYLDQRLDSVWSSVSYYLKKVGQPLGRAGQWLGKKSLTLMKQLGKRTTKLTQPIAERFKTVLVQRTVRKAVKEQIETTSEAEQSSDDKALQAPSPTLPLFGQLHRIKTRLPNLKLPDLKLPSLNKATSLSIESGVPINHYSNRKTTNRLLIKLLHTPLLLLQDLGKQFRLAFRRSPQTWYIIIALVLLSSIGASIHTRKAKGLAHPAISAATLEEMKSLAEEARQAKVYGDNDKARQLMVGALAKGDLAKQNPKLTAEVSKTYGSVQRDLYSLAGATELTAPQPLLSNIVSSGPAAVAEGVYYTVTSDGRLISQLLTGGEPVTLGQLPGGQTAHQLYLDPTTKKIYLQNYTGQLYLYDPSTKKLARLTSDQSVPVATGLSSFNNILYLLDPAGNQIWKLSQGEDETWQKAAYTKGKQPDFTNTLGLAIDGSVFTLHKNGKVTKFVRGNWATDFSLKNIPKPFDNLPAPLAFAAVEDGGSYYLADRGNQTLPPRIIELDKTGLFSHQYLLPRKWQKDIKQVILNPKSHKA